MGYVLINEIYGCTCMNSNNTAVNAGRKCGLRVYRWVEAGETTVPKQSLYKFVHLLASVDATEQRYQHKWNASVKLDGVDKRNWSDVFYFPQSSLLNTSGYMRMVKGTYYETLQHTELLNNDGATHYVNITASCAVTTPKTCSATLSFTTPTSVVAPEISNLVVSQDATGKLNTIICNCGGNSAPTWFECTVTRYNNNGSAAASETYNIAADTINPWRIEISATQLPLLMDVVAGDAVHIKLEALNYAGSSEDTEFVVYPGAGACKIAGGVFKNATPYIKDNGVWMPAITYADYNDEWVLTRQGVEIDYVLSE